MKLTVTITWAGEEAPAETVHLLSNEAVADWYCDLVRKVGRGAKVQKLSLVYAQGEGTVESGEIPPPLASSPMIH